ncbi:hypothetical protein R5W23_003336 [Gemmata sp. JC673]|uniref:Stress-associated endoplasmic reticulum protein n=1 Tax=Gemmata algarum TaxID=2975278 RepID=A0ABU5F2U6_9BACT|nr:hypothetical protein [Gemmata algarum]MDY3561906.1 hypothetical protein [Gemmata algarum]
MLAAKKHKPQAEEMGHKKAQKAQKETKEKNKRLISTQLFCFWFWFPFVLLCLFVAHLFGFT